MPSCRLIWNTSCKVCVMFASLNLSQVVNLKLERCVFFGSLFCLPCFNVVYLFFLIQKCCLRPGCPTFIIIIIIIIKLYFVKNYIDLKWLSCKGSFYTLWNASEVTISELERCSFRILRFIQSSIITCCFLRFENFAIHVWPFFNCHRNLKKMYLFHLFPNGSDVRNINNKKLWRH